MNGKEYLNSVIENTTRLHPTEPEYLQTVAEVLAPLGPVLDKHPAYIDSAVVPRLLEPEHIYGFRVCWVDDRGQVQVNRGWRVQFNSALGPYKGGLRFNKNVNLSVLKFLGLEQTFKNSISDLPMGGAKGGADFDPKGKSDGEIMRFCQAFMNGLYRHIGDNVDVPAGDLGVGAREIGYLFGQYKALTAKFTGVLTGKGISFGGSSIRMEATGFGAVYFADRLLRDMGQSLEGKRVAVSGFGNVAWGACMKLGEMGAKVVTISGPDGYIYDPDGVAGEEKLNYMLEMRNSNHDRVQDYSDKFGCEFFPGQKPWVRDDVDILMPCATQNEIGVADAETIIKNKIPCLFEVSNMPTTNEAMALLKAAGLTIAPSKAVNCGGVMVSCLEMAQNAGHIYWPAAEVDEKLHLLMDRLYNTCRSAAENYGYGSDLVAGANVAGFLKVADAMERQGIVN